MKLKSVFILACAAVFLCSCSEVVSTGTMKILLHTDTTKTLTLGDTVLDITKYTVNGTGPGNKTFAVDSTSASITLNGMVLGQWEITATGYNSKGKEIAFGSTSFNLSSTEKNCTVILSSLRGTGSCQLTYEWDSDVSDPKLEITIIPYSGNNKLTRAIKPNSGSTSCTLTISDLPSGFYTVNTVLYNNSQTIVGTNEALRIANSEKTTGTISFKSASAYSSELTSLNVFRKDDNNLTGHLSGVSDIVNAGEELAISLLLDSSYSESEGCEICWYLDGELLKNWEDLSPFENLVSFYPQIGTHILNAIVKCPESESLGSVSAKISSKTTGLKGVAVYISTIKPSSNAELNLSNKTIMAALPSDRFLILSPESGTMRLCSVYNNSLSINSKSSANEEGFSWITEANGLFSSYHMTNFAVLDSSMNLNILYFNQAKSKIERAYRGGDVARYETTFTESIFTFPLENLDYISLFHTNDTAGNIVIPSKTGTSMLELGTNGTGLTTVTFLQKPTSVTHINNIAIGFEKIALISDDSDNFYSASFNGNTRTTMWESCQTSYDSPTLIRFLNGENIIVADNQGLSRYSYTKTAGWRYRSSFDTTVKFLEVSDDGSIFWVLTQDNVLESYTTQDNLIHVIGRVKLNEQITSMVRSENYILLKTITNALILCQISQGD